MLQASDRVNPLPVGDELHRVVPECRDDQDSAFGIQTIVVHAAIHARQSDARPQVNGRQLARV